MLPAGKNFQILESASLTWLHPQPIEEDRLVRHRGKPALIAVLRFFGYFGGQSTHPEEAQGGEGEREFERIPNHVPRYFEFACWVERGTPGRQCRGGGWLQGK